MRERREQTVHYGVDDLTLLRHNVDRARESDQHRRERHRSKSVYECFRRAIDAEAADQSDDDAHDEEERGHLIEVPAEFHHPKDENRERDEDGDQHQTVACVERLFLFADFARASGASRSRISTDSRNPKRQCQHQKDQPEPRRREKRKSCELLRDSYLKWIDRTERGAHTGRTNTHRSCDDVIESQSRREQEQRRHQRNDFFVHVVQRTRGSERQANDRNHQQLATLETPHHPSDSSAQRSRLIHYAERSADQENEEDYRCGGGHSPRNRDHRLERRDGRLWNRVIGSGDYNLTARCRIVAPVELAGGEHVSHHRRQHDESHQ